MTYTKEQKTYNFIHEKVKLTKLNKREAVTRDAYINYKNSSDYILSHVYKKPSLYKVRAFENIMEEVFIHNGYGLKVIAYNAQMFTCGYMLELHGDTYFIRHTASYVDCVKVAI